MTPARVRVLVPALAVALAGCGANMAFVGSTGSVVLPPTAPVVPPPGFSASVTISIGSTAANAIAAGAILGFLAAGNEVSPLPPLPMRPDRTISEQDCTKPLVGATANLKCSTASAAVASARDGKQ